MEVSDVEGNEIADDAQKSSQGDLYYDGSYEAGDIHPECGRAGWGVVQIDDQGKIVKKLQGTVPPTLALRSLPNFAPKLIFS